MYHLHIYMKDMVGFEPILHSLNDENAFLEQQVNFTKILGILYETLVHSII